MTNKWRVGMGGTALGVGTVVGTLVAALGSRAWILDLIANFRFQYMWLGVLALIPIGWNRWWRTFTVIALGVLLNLLAIGPYFWGSIVNAAGDDRLTIVHLNTQAANRDKAAVVEFLQEAEADIIFLAEVTPALLDLMEGTTLPYDPVAGTPSVTPIGLLALSRDPSVSGRVSNLGETGVPALILETTLGARPIEIVGFHTTSPGGGDRTAARDDQLDGAADRVSQRDTPMILVGDFNATQWTSAFQDLIDSGLVDAQRGRGVAGSWPAGWGPFKIPIDHVLHTPDLTTTSFGFGPSAGSDHRSLAVTLAIARG